MTPQKFDLVVIGAGPAGEKGAAQAAYFGKRVAIVERAPEPGGAQVHTGTLPSKTLRETALWLSGLASRRQAGVSTRLLDRHTAVPALIARKDAIAAAEAARMRENLYRHGVTYIRGCARFVGPRLVEVACPDETVDRHGELGDDTRRLLEADVVLIATGSSPRRPPDLPWGDPDLEDSDDILSIDRLPSSLAVLGAGVIGCEYACMFAALGCVITLIEPRAELLTFLDREVCERLRSAMASLGIALRAGTAWTGVTRTGEGLRVGLAGGAAVTAEKVLFCAGRVGATASLGLEAIGIVPDARGNIPVDEHYATKAPGVYAAGDVIGFPALASASMEQGRVAVCHAFDWRYKTAVSRLIPYGIYTIPEVSSVGKTEQACREEHVPHVIGRALHKDNARGQITGDLEGLTKLIVHAETRKLLGVHVVGERASEHIHVGQTVLALGGTVDVFIDLVFNHPTLGEAYKYAAYDALGALSRRELSRSSAQPT